MRVAKPYLTDIELNAISLMAQGHRVKTVAAKLGVSHNCISKTLRRAIRRNGVRNYLQLGMLIERCQTLPVVERNRIEDRREVMLDAGRMGAR